MGELLAMNGKLLFLATVLFLTGCSAGTSLSDKDRRTVDEPGTVENSAPVQQSTLAAAVPVAPAAKAAKDPAKDPAKVAQDKLEQDKKERTEKVLKLLNPASFCKYRFEGLDSYDYKKYPGWEELGLNAKLAKKLDDKPYPDEVTPVLDKNGCQDQLKRLDQKGRLGVCKADGSVVLKPLYDYLDYPQSSPSKWILCCIKGRFEDKKSDTGFRFVGKNGKELSKDRYYNALPFNEGRAAVQLEDKGWGFIDETGKMVIPCKFGSVRSFCEGYATVTSETSGKIWGYIDRDGKELIPPIFDANSNFKDGYAKVRYQHLWGILKKEQLEKLRAAL